jgi:cob(I)alamin adenosyltransferase
MSDKARILLFTGDGKGKTTAALGLALRAAGHGIASIILQFIKKDPAIGEAAGVGFLPDVLLAQMGEGFVPPPSDPRFAQHRTAARAGLRRVEQAIASGAYGIVILDEVCLAVALGLLEELDVVAAVRKAPAWMCVVLTGRGAAPGLLELADTVTEMKCLKHAHQEGTAAQKGVEF